MAKSSNKRKNGKRVVNNHAERLKRLQARDIVGLMVCNAVGTSEVKGDRNELTPRTCVYSLPKRNITTITSRQAQALKNSGGRGTFSSALFVASLTGKFT